MPEYRSASGSAAEDLFIDLFADTFGAEKAGYLYSQYPFYDIYQNARFADFVLENGAARVAIEIDDEASHNPRLVSQDKFYDDLLKQNSMIHLGWDVYRWAVRQRQKQPETVKDELRVFLGSDPRFKEIEDYLPTQQGRALKADQLELREYQQEALDSLETMRRNRETIALLYHATLADKKPIITILYSCRFPCPVNKTIYAVSTMKSTIHSPVFIRDIRPTIVEYKDTFHNSSQDGEMMNLFNALPSELFSILASPNRLLYADALDVLYEAYRDNLKIPEQTLYSMLRSRLERQLAEANFDGEDIDEEELRDISGRARFLIRKLCSRGWFEKERGDDFEEYITVPGYSSRLLELFHQLTDDSPLRGYSFVLSTYSTLKVADEGNNAYDRMTAIYSAYDNTQELIKMLQMVYHNVKHYFKIQVEMRNINKVLASHFDDFGQKVVETYIRPLKIKDSVPKYKVPTLIILNKWMEDDGILYAISNAAYQDKRGDSVDACRNDLLTKIYWIKERYESIEREYLDEIDSQVRRYTRATTQKIENLTNRDQNVRGNLNYLLTRLSQNRPSSEFVENIQPALQLFEQSYISEKSLWHSRRPRKRTVSEPVFVEDHEPDADLISDAEDLLHAKYGRAAVADFMRERFSDRDELNSKDLALHDDNSYIMSILAFLRGEDEDSFYSVQSFHAEYREGDYSIPQLKFSRKEGKK